MGLPGGSWPRTARRIWLTAAAAGVPMAAGGIAAVSALMNGGAGGRFVALAVPSARVPVRSAPKKRYSSAPNGALTSRITRTQTSFGALRTDLALARLTRQ